MEDEPINQNYLIGCDTIENSPSLFQWCNIVQGQTRTCTVNNSLLTTKFRTMTNLCLAVSHQCASKEGEGVFIAWMFSSLCIWGMAESRSLPYQHLLCTSPSVSGQAFCSPQKVGPYDVNITWMWWILISKQLAINVVFVYFQNIYKKNFKSSVQCQGQA